MPIELQLPQPPEPPATTGPPQGWLGRLVTQLRALARRSAEVVVVVVELTDGTPLEVPHNLGRVPLAVPAEVSGGRATVEIATKTATTVTVEITTTPSSQTRTVTLALIG